MAEKHHARAARPEVLPLLVRAETLHCGCVAEFPGTEEQLTAAGLAEASWLESSEFGVSGQRMLSAIEESLRSILEES